MLQELGHEVVVAAGGVEAWDLLSASPVQVAVIDWVMPDVDGLELCRRIRAGAAQEYTDFLTKPFDPDLLGARLRVAERILGLRRHVDRSRGAGRTLRGVGRGPHELIGAPVFAAVAVSMSWLATTRRRAQSDRAEALAREHAARAEAETANRAKDEFLAVLGHELRNPLAAITSAVRVLEATHTRDEMAARARELISRQAVNLGRLVDDLLEVNRVLKGKVPLNRRLTDVSDVVRRTVAALGDAGRLQRHGLKLDLQTVWVDADPVRLEQVVTNLLDNAVKYTPEHGTIDIALRAEGARAVLDVRDTGIGIPPTCCPGCSSPSSRAIPARATRTAVSASASPSSAA